MNLKKMLVPAALIAVLAPLAAFAEHDDYAGYGNNEPAQVASQYARRPMPPTHESQGRYEMRTTQQWVPGQYTQVWVPEQCVSRQRGWGTRVRCRPGFYDQRWTPGHYVSAQQWVWVPFNHPPAPHPQRYGRYRNHDRHHDRHQGYEQPRHYATPVR